MYPLNDNTVSRYFVKNDEASNVCLMQFPDDWWSRWYEYKWAMSFVEEKDVCLDVACGVPHPFKFYLASRCEEVHACDSDEKIKDYNAILAGVRGYFNEVDTQKARIYMDDIQFKCLDVTYLKNYYATEQFDKIYCISALEHMPYPVVTKALQAFFEILKVGGLVVLTIDVPSMPITYIVETAKNCGFQLVGELDETLPPDAIYSPLLGGLNCFRILLTKP